MFAAKQQNSNPFSMTAQIVKPIFMADKSMRLLLEYGEVSPEDVATVCDLMRGNVRVIIVREDDMKAIET